MRRIEGLSEEETRALEVLRALGNPARLRIVSELSTRDACVTAEMVGVLPLAQSTVSEHLKVLKEAGVVRGTTDTDVCFCLDGETLAWLASFCSKLAACCPATEERPAGTSSPAGDCEDPRCD